MATDSNLALILGRVHREGPASRAQLTRETGLNRSTVAAVVAELVERGLVLEEAPDATRQVGRPSPVVRPDPGVTAVAAVTEVDAVTVAVVDLTGRVQQQLRVETSAAPSVREAVAAVQLCLSRLRAGRGPSWRPSGLGVAVPGLVRAGDGVVRWAPHLRWRDEPLAAMLEQATGLPVRAGNDANLGARAEHLFGAARGASHVLYVNGGSSGIGGGVIVDDRMLLGADGYAGELGHSTTRDSGELEDAVSRRRLLDLLGWAHATDERLEQALRTDPRPEVTHEVRRQLGVLSTGVRDMINVFNPERVVLGGFLGIMFAMDPDHFRDAVGRQALRPAWDSVTVVRAALGADLLLVGAAELVLEQVVAQASPAPALSALPV